MPVGEADGGWAVRELPADLNARTLQDLRVLFSLPGSLWALQIPQVFPGTRFLCTLSGLSPQNSGDPKSEPAHITDASDPKEPPTNCLLS